MENTLGKRIASLRKQTGMTQMELAEKMGVTDKAVSKWERDLSCPDVNTIAKLAECFGISMDALMEITIEKGEKTGSNLVLTIMKAVAVAMGVSVGVLSAIGKLDVNSGLGMLGIGLACLAITALSNRE